MRRWVPHVTRRWAARIRPPDLGVSARPTCTTHRIAGRGGLCCARRRTLRGAPDGCALACRWQASRRLGAQGGMLSMRAGIMGGKGRRRRAGVEVGNDRLAGRVGQASSAHGGHAGQPGRLRCLFAKRLRRERRRGAGAGIARLGVSIAFRCRVQAEAARGCHPRRMLCRQRPGWMSRRCRCWSPHAAYRFEMLHQVGAAAPSAAHPDTARPGVTSRALSGAKVRSRPEARGGFTVRGDEASATQALSMRMTTMQIAAVHAALRLRAAQRIGAALSRLSLHGGESLC